MTHQLAQNKSIPNKKEGVSDRIGWELGMV